MATYMLNGVILAGGLSRRFGSPKAFAIYKGKFFYQLIMDAMEPYTDIMTIISQESIYSRFLHDNRYVLLKDNEKYKGMGPLAGIYSAMEMVDAEWHFIFACDLPNISSSFVEKMVSLTSYHPDMIIPRVSGKVQPLAALYHCSVFPIIENLLENRQYRVIDLLEKGNPLFVDESELGAKEELFKNINDQVDYQWLNQQRIDDRKKIIQSD